MCDQPLHVLAQLAVIPAREVEKRRALSALPFARGLKQFLDARRSGCACQGKFLLV